MQVTCNVNLNGLEEMLNQVGPKLAKSHLRKALKAGAEVIEAEAKMRAPVDTGALRDSIDTVVKISAKQENGRASVGPVYDRNAKKGSQDPGVYGLWVETGLQSRPGYPQQPFLRPALDSKGNEAVEKLVEVLREGLEEALKP